MRCGYFIPKFAKWGGAAAAFLLAATLITSCFRCIGWWATDSVMIAVDAGRLLVFLEPSENDFGEELWNRSHPFEHSWQFAWRTSPTEDGTQTDHFIFVPIWPLLAGAITAVVVAARFDTLACRSRLNRCLTCNYELAGLGTAAVCPECGCARRTFTPAVEKR